MFDTDLSFNSILTSLESTLSIEMTSGATVADIIQDACNRLENTYACKLDKDIYTLQSESQLVASNLDLLLKDLQQCLAMLSFYLNLKLYHTNMGITLADVNYLGYNKERLLTDLKYLMYETEAKKHSEDIIPPLYDTLNQIAMCSVKRLFVSMLMLYRLGVYEGVAIVAQFLYVGGLVI